MKVKEMVSSFSLKSSEAKMGRGLLSPVLKRELANLDKDGESRRLAMKALKSYVEDLDSSEIPNFISQVSETKETCSVSEEYTISLYEVLARVHGVSIVPQIDTIMKIILRTLASSAGSFSLQQACSKVVPAIAVHGIDSATPEKIKRRIMHSLCKPLSDSLLSCQESLSSGAALCLKALVDLDNWRFASDDMVNTVCQNVAAALDEKSMNSHMGLVMSLAKHNALVVEAYARLLIRSGMRILNAGIVEGNSQKRLNAVKMVNFLMKCLDPRSVYSELEFIIEEMEKCHTDHMAFVKGAAFEALETARKIMADEDLKYEKVSSSVTGSNFSRRERSRSLNTSNDSDRSPASMSPESQTLDSYIEYESFIESPISSQVSCNLDYGNRSANRKLWSYENGGVDISLKDGLFSEMSQGLAFSNAHHEHNRHHERKERREDFTGEFEGFSQKSPQDQSDSNSDFSQQTRILRSRPATTRYHEDKETGNLYASGEKSESVSSTDDIPADFGVQVSHEKVAGRKTQDQLLVAKRRRKITASKLVLGLFFILVAAFVSYLGIESDSQGYVHLVPT